MPIDRLEVFVTDLPGRLQRTISSGSYDTGASRSMLGKPVLVRLFADGVVGCGQIRPISPGHFMPDTPQSAVAAIVEVYGPQLIGRSLFDTEAIWAMFDSGLPGNSVARAALDHAIHDAQGKALGLPAYSLLGGLCQDPIPLEWSVSMAEEISTVVAEASRAVGHFGVKVLCIKAADRRGWQHDVTAFAAVRKEVGDTVQIGIDPNSGWSLPDAKRAITALRAFRLDYIEQPIDRRDLAGLCEVRDHAAGIPVMADESLFTLQDAHALNEARAADVFCIKLYKHGGLRQAKKIAAVAEGANKLINVGGLAAFCQLEAAAGAHFYASTPAARMMPAGEFLFGLGVIGPDPLVPETDFVIKDGHVTVPKRPGLGIEIDQKALGLHTLVREVITG
jgi:L-alanine-DL-glutamate epimerase-like enolase superfamily enzyme